MQSVQKILSGREMKSTFVVPIRSSLSRHHRAADRRHCAGSIDCQHFLCGSTVAQSGEPCVGVIFDTNRVGVELAAVELGASFGFGGQGIAGEFHLVAIGIGIVKRSAHAVMDRPIGDDAIGFQLRIIFQKVA